MVVGALANGAKVDMVAGFARRVREGIRHVVSLPDAVIEPLMVAMVAKGHVLIEGIPGTGKTLLARTIARLLGLDFKRIQF
ncbi:MAG TPA: AAA family ATPase, partial [Planctomycetota bacterium]|nr:AAA family ATPase [Planctomycetota bacterium]